MKVKSKISVRKVLRTVFTAVVTICCIAAMISAARIEGEEKVKRVAIYIKNDKKYHFIEQEEIKEQVFGARNIDICNTTLSQLDIQGMEKTLLSNPWVAAAEVYIDNDKVLHINVTQRLPVARLFQQNNMSYYIDTTLSVMPLSKNYIYYTTVVTNVPDIMNDTVGRGLKKEIVTMARAIQSDSFWNAQVSEVTIDSDGSFELTPVLGNQQIIFGDTSRIRDKFANLFAFYSKVLNRIGWDKYDKLDVRFNGQVVASPSLPYKGPVDKAVVNMNWINSMVETSARNETKDTVDPGPDMNAAPAEKKPAPARPAPAKTAKAPAKAADKKAAKQPEPHAKPKAVKAPPRAVKPGKDKAKKDKEKDKNGKGKTDKKPRYVYPEKKDH